MHRIEIGISGKAGTRTRTRGRTAHLSRRQRKHAEIPNRGREDRSRDQLHGLQKQPRRQVDHAQASQPLHDPSQIARNGRQDRRGVVVQKDLDAGERAAEELRDDEHGPTERLERAKRGGGQGAERSAAAIVVVTGAVARVERLELVLLLEECDEVRVPGQAKVRLAQLEADLLVVEDPRVHRERVPEDERVEVDGERERELDRQPELRGYGGEVVARAGAPRVLVEDEAFDVEGPEAVA